MITKSATIFHYSSTMVYVIDRYQKLGKQDIKRLDNTTDPSSAHSTPSNSYEKLIKNTDITSKKSLTAEIHSSATFFLDDKLADIIKTEPVSKSCTKYMLISNISVDDDSHSFENIIKNNYIVTTPRTHTLMCCDNAQLSETPRIYNHSVTAQSAYIFGVDDGAQSFETLRRKQSQCHYTKFPGFVGLLQCPVVWNSQKNNHIVTAPSAQILLGYDSLKYQHKNIFHRPVQKLPPPVKWYLCFQMDGEISHAAQCYKLSAFIILIDLIIDIHSFDHQCVIIKVILQSKRLKQHMVTIGVDQSLSNSAMYEHRCL